MPKWFKTKEPLPDKMLFTICPAPACFQASGKTGFQVLPLLSWTSSLQAWDPQTRSLLLWGWEVLSGCTSGWWGERGTPRQRLGLDWEMPLTEIQSRCLNVSWTPVSSDIKWGEQGRLSSLCRNWVRTNRPITLRSSILVSLKSHSVIFTRKKTTSSIGSLRYMSKDLEWASK